tara:strand:- start:494 stop:1348 length:855 start_codon:yes stop_codon:yes gene_type:complete
MKNIGIVGNGFVGSAIVSGFNLHANIKIYDLDPAKSTHTFEEVINHSDFVFVCVPTPMTNVEGGVIDLKIMDSVFEDIVNVKKREGFSYEDVVFIIKSTVVPGTTEKYQKRYPDLRIAFNPEFLTERAARLDFINAPRIILGGEQEDLNKIEGLYRERFPHTPIIKTDVATSQFIKYMANCFFAVKVSFMNEMRQASDALNCNWEEAMAGFITDGRIGNSHLDVPGHDGSLGYGGKCFPKDINAFIGLFESIGVDPVVMKASWQKNLEVRQTRDWADIKGAVSE